MLAPEVMEETSTSGEKPNRKGSGGEYVITDPRLHMLEDVDTPVWFYRYASEPNSNTNGRE